MCLHILFAGYCWFILMTYKWCSLAKVRLYQQVDTADARDADSSTDLLVDGEVSQSETAADRTVISVTCFCTRAIIG